MQPHQHEEDRSAASNPTLQIIVELSVSVAQKARDPGTLLVLT
jgi:hypothetical protein